MKQQNVHKLEITVALKKTTEGLQCCPDTSTVANSASQVEIMNILRSDTAEVNIHPNISINETLSKVSQLEALNIPQTPIVDQMVVLNTKKIQTTNKLGRLKTLERPVMKLLETSDKPKIKQSQEADPLEQVSTSKNQLHYKKIKRTKKQKLYFLIHLGSFSKKCQFLS